MTYARLDATEARDQAERLARVEADGIRERDRRIAEMKRQTEARQAARAKAAAEQEKAAKALEDKHLADLARAGDVALEQEKAVHRRAYCAAGGSQADFERGWPKLKAELIHERATMAVTEGRAQARAAWRTGVWTAH